MQAYLLAQALRPGLNAVLEANLNLCLKRLLHSNTPTSNGSPCGRWPNHW